MVDSSTAAEATETKATKERKRKSQKPEKTRAQKDKHNASCQKSRREAKRKREELEAMVAVVPELQAENQRMKAEIERMKAEMERMKAGQGIKIERQGLREALEIGEAKEELMKQIPCAWKVDGTNFGSFDQAETWFLSQTYDQGPNDTENKTTASAAAGPSCVANHGLPNKPDNSPFSHDPAAGHKTGFPSASAADSFLAAYPELAAAFDGLYNPSTSDFFTNHDLAAEFPTSSAASSSLIVGHESSVMFDAPNNHDTVNNLSNHDPAAGFPSASAAGSFSYDIGGLFTHDSAADDKAGFPF
ncbi:uncharacterized protein LOC110416059 [Herrania umbratica]|uniref:Uncharacterized protein LOC110416059 n=1 Tax=Herrania umbratica TaxID=108875 RepID=A0A6J1A8W7_9ROSI|nr:uncharacterized protein LOC110416059 [Herrania umbratica]XP_021283587.1 uncharacterized protein LOC110416059 [Herrania umbratica]